MKRARHRAREQVEKAALGLSHTCQLKPSSEESASQGEGTGGEGSTGFESHLSIKAE